MSIAADKIVVIGATGKIGRLVVVELARRGLPSKAFSRTVAKLELPILSEAFIGDLEDIASLERAVAGSTKVFLLWPHLTSNGAQAVVTAISRHARRIVYLSTAGAGDAADRALNPVSRVHHDIENMIRAAVPEWTFVRPYGFASNTLLWADQIRRGDTVRWPYARAQRTLVHDGDLAEVIVAALTQDTMLGKTLTLSGAQTLPQAAQVALIGEVLGKPLVLEEEKASVTREQMLGWGLPLPFVDGVLGYWAKCVTDPEPVNQVVEEVTGRPPRSLRDWIAENAEKFR